MSATKVTKETLIDALDSVTWYNGLCEEIERWASLPKNKQYNSIPVPEICWHQEQLQVIWMIAVNLFGNYGTSPRGGWIEDVDGFRQFCLDITKTWREEKEDRL